MLFSSLIFLYAFLPGTLLLYFLVPRKCKNFILLLASLTFYAWGEPKYLLLILLSILLGYGTALESTGSEVGLVPTVSACICFRQFGAFGLV